MDSRLQYVLTLDASTFHFTSARVEYRLEIAQLPFQRDGLGLLEVLVSDGWHTAGSRSRHMLILVALEITAVHW